MLKSTKGFFIRSLLTFIISEVLVAMELIIVCMMMFVYSFYKSRASEIRVGGLFVLVCIIYTIFPIVTFVFAITFKTKTNRNSSANYVRKLCTTNKILSILGIVWGVVVSVSSFVFMCYMTDDALTHLDTTIPFFFLTIADGIFLVIMYALQCVALSRISRSIQNVPEVV